MCCARCATDVAQSCMAAGWHFDTVVSGRGSWVLFRMPHAMCYSVVIRCSWMRNGCSPPPPPERLRGAIGLSIARKVL